MKILVIRFLHIGDVLLTSTICSSLKKSLPDAQIDYLMHELAAPLFDHHPDLDAVLTLSPGERKNPLRYIRKIWNISRNDYDIIIDATSTAKSELISLFSYKANYRIGRYKRGRGLFYTHRIPESALAQDKILQRLAMLSPLIDAGLPIELTAQMRLKISEQEREQVRRHMRNAGIDFDRPIFAFSVSAKESHKKWAADHMQQIAQHCLQQFKAQIVVLSGLPHEYDQVQQFYQSMDQHSDVFVDLPSNSLRKLIALLGECDVFIGNEGGPRHMAQAMGTPTIAIFSPSARKPEWLPSGDSRHCGIEWQDIAGETIPIVERVKKDDERYQEYYELIEPRFVIPLIDSVITQHVDKFISHS